MTSDNYDYSKIGNVFKVGTVEIQDIIDNITKTNNFEESGAIFSFTGTVRNSSLEKDKKVIAIEIDAWEEKAIESLNKICKELKEKHKLIDIRIWHAVGRLELKDEIVFVVLASAHRKEGIKALDEAIDAYKHLSPIWKKEIYEDSSSEWISKSSSFVNY